VKAEQREILPQPPKPLKFLNIYEILAQERSVLTICSTVINGVGKTTYPNARKV
jgi:hypothetical protein